MTKYIDKIITDDTYTIRDSVAQERIDNLVEMGENAYKFIFFGSGYGEQSGTRNQLGECEIAYEVDGNSFVIHDFGYDVNKFGSVLTYLISKGLTKCEGIIISHYHDDHIGGFNTFINSSFIDFSECVAYLPHGSINWSSGVWEHDYQSFQNQVKTSLNNKGITIIEPSVENSTYAINEYLKVKFNNVSNFTDYYSYKLDQYGRDTDYTTYNNFSMITTFKHKLNDIVIVGDIQEIAEKHNVDVLMNADVFTFAHHSLNRPHYIDYTRNMPRNKVGIICTGARYWGDWITLKNDVMSCLDSGTDVYVTGNQQTGYVDITSTDDINVEATSKMTYYGDMGHGYGIPYRTSDIDITDMNDLIKCGTYSFLDADTIEMMANRPWKNWGCIVDVYMSNADYKIMQVAKSNSSGTTTDYVGVIAMRSGTINNSAFDEEGQPVYTWSKWRYISTSPLVNIPIQPRHYVANNVNKTSNNYNYISLINGQLSLAFDFKTTASIPNGTEIIKVNLGINAQFNSHIMGWVYGTNNPERFTPLVITTDSDGNVIVKTNRVIDSGKQIVGSFSFGIMIKNEATISHFSMSRSYE